MSCFVETTKLDPFTVGKCFAIVPGAKDAKALFRVDPPIPENFGVQWSDPKCTPNHTTCSVTIQAFLSKTMTATVLDFDDFTFFQVSATASFEDGR
jgi:hypothetical protein